MKTRDEPRRYRMAPDVRFRKVGGEGVVVRQEAAEVVVVDGVGAAVLELLDPRRYAAAEAGRRVDGLIAGLVADHDAPEETIAGDVADFLEELLAAGVIEEV